MERKNIWEKYPEGKRAGLLDFAEKYRQFISRCKTERECTAKFAKMAVNAGFTKMEEIIGCTEEALDDDAESIITNERYEYISGLMHQCVRKKRAGWNRG